MADEPVTAASSIIPNPAPTAMEVDNPEETVKADDTTTQEKAPAVDEVTTSAEKEAGEQPPCLRRTYPNFTHRSSLLHSFQILFIELYKAALLWTRAVERKFFISVETLLAPSIPTNFQNTLINKC